MKRIAFAGALGLAVVLAGCTTHQEATFATRNAQADLDLHSLVRSQSNELLSLTQALAGHAESAFSSNRKLEKDLAETLDHMDQLHLNLPSLLATQDVELAELRQQVQDGTIDTSALKLRAAEIQTYRKGLLASLDASASRATLTANTLGGREAVSQAQKAEALAQDLKSARTMIAMQL